MAAPDYLYSLSGWFQTKTGTSLIHISDLFAGISSGGSTPITRLEFRNNALSNTSQSIKNTATALYSYNIINLNSTIIFLKFYNKASAAVVANDIPLLTLAIPAFATSLERFTGVSIKDFSLGMQVLCVLGVDNTDNTPPVEPILLEATYA